MEGNKNDRGPKPPAEAPAGREGLTAELIHAEKLAAIGQLAAGVAHEINNPASFVMANLNQVTSYTATVIELLRETRALILERGDDATRARFEALELQYDIRYLEKDLEDLISESLEGMVRIRNIVSNLSKFSSWGDREVSEIDVNQMTESVLNLAMSEIRPRGRLERRFGPVPPVHNVQARLANALLNVVVNAAQSLDEGRAARNLIVVSTGVDQGRIFIRVNDNGPGVPASILPRIFDPFFTTKKAGVGSGLGLTLARDLMAKAGGEIAVESQEGQGSTFTLWLPIEREAPGESPARANPAAKVRRPRVLVVDDERLMLKAMGRMLERDFEAKLAGGAEEALALLEQDQDFDLIVSDLIMPDRDGQYLYAQAIQRWPELEPRFLFFTGGAYPPHLKDFFQAMKTRTILKPLEREKILAELNRHLAKTKT